MLCLATTLLAVRSIRWADLLSFRVGQRFGYLKSVAGSLELSWHCFANGNVDEFTRGQRVYDNYFRVERREGWWRSEWFTCLHGPTVDSAQLGGVTYTQITIPHWFIITVSGVPAAWFGRRWCHEARDRRRASLGRCRFCGYDLRASIVRCPECGEPHGGSASDN